MKLILKEDVDGLGTAGDVVEVKDGYGRNFLIPRGVAFVATKGAEKDIVAIKRARRARISATLDGARAAAAQLKDLPVTLASRAGKEGRLFGSVTAADVAAAVRDAGGPTVDRRSIDFPTPVKSVGTHQVHVRLHPEVVGTVTLTVTAG